MSSRRGRWIAAYALVVAAFLASVTRYYHPTFGFTAFIDFSAAGHADEIPAVQNVPHFDNPSGGYDGMFYAQLAVDPLLRDPSIDRALDNPAYRARRILFSWTAYALGLGRPAWILQAYAIQNVIAWLLMAWLLCRWMPPSTPRAFALWTGCLLSPGMVSSVRYALPDLPCALLIASAVLVAERLPNHPIIAGAIVGLAGLGRETSLLATTLLGTLVKRGWRPCLLVAVALVVCLLPLALWVDYLRSIYFAQAFTNPGQISTPLAGLSWKLNTVGTDLSRAPFEILHVASALAVVAFLAQGAWVVRELVRPGTRSAWVFVGGSYLVLGLVTHPVVWQGTPGAFTRVLLPLAIAANVLLAARPRPSWAMIVATNACAIPSAFLFGWG